MLQVPKRILNSNMTYPVISTTSLVRDLDRLDTRRALYATTPKVVEVRQVDSESHEEFMVGIYQRRSFYPGVINFIWGNGNYSGRPSEIKIFADVMLFKYSHHLNPFITIQKSTQNYQYMTFQILLNSWIFQRIGNTFIHANYFRDSVYLKYSSHFRNSNPLQ